MAEPDKMFGTCQFFFSTLEKDLQYLKTTEDQLNHHVEAVKNFAKLYNYNCLIDGEQVKSNSVKQSWRHILISTAELVLNIKEPPSYDQLQDLSSTLKSIAENRNEPEFLKLLELFERGPWSQPCLKMLIENKKIDSKKMSEMLEDDGNIKIYLNALKKASYLQQATTLAVAVLIHPTMKDSYQGACQMSLMSCLDEIEIAQYMKFMDLGITLKIILAGIEKGDVNGVRTICDAAFYYVLETEDLNITEDFATCWYKLSIVHSSEKQMFSKIVKELVPTKINTVPQCIILTKALWKTVPTSSRITCVEILHHALHLLSPDNQQMKEGILSSIIYMLPNSHIARSCAFTSFLENPSTKHYFILCNMFKVEYNKHVDIAKECSAQLRVQLLTYLQQRWPPELPASVDWVWGPLRDFCLSLLHEDDVNYINEVESENEPQINTDAQSRMNLTDFFSDTTIQTESDSSDNEEVDSQHEEERERNREVEGSGCIDTTNADEVEESPVDVEKESKRVVGNDVIMSETVDAASGDPKINVDDHMSKEMTAEPTTSEMNFENSIDVEEKSATDLEPSTTSVAMDSKVTDAESDPRTNINLTKLQQSSNPAPDASLLRDDDDKNNESEVVSASNCSAVSIGSVNGEQISQTGIPCNDALTDKVYSNTSIETAQVITPNKDVEINLELQQPALSSSFKGVHVEVSKSSKPQRKSKKVRQKSPKTTIDANDKPWKCPVEVCSRSLRAKRAMSHHLVSVHKWLQTEVKGFYQSLSFVNPTYTPKTEEHSETGDKVSELLGQEIKDKIKSTEDSGGGKPGSEQCQTLSLDGQPENDDCNKKLGNLNKEYSEVIETVHRVGNRLKETLLNPEPTPDNVSLENENLSEKLTNQLGFENLAIPVDNKNPLETNNASKLTTVEESSGADNRATSVTSPRNDVGPVVPIPEAAVAKKPAALSIECPVQGCTRTFRHRHTVQAHIEFKHKIPSKEASEMTKNAKLNVQPTSNAAVSNPNGPEVDISSSRGWYWQVDGFLFQDMNQNGNPDLHILNRRQEGNKRNSVARDVMCLLGSAPLSFNLNSTMDYIEENWQSLADRTSTDAVSSENKTIALVSPNRTPIPLDAQESFHTDKELSPVMDSQMFEFHHDVGGVDFELENSNAPEPPLVARNLSSAKSLMRVNVKVKHKKIAAGSNKEATGCKATQTHFIDKEHFHNHRFNKIRKSSSPPTYDGPTLCIRYDNGKETVSRTITTQCCDQPSKGLDELMQGTRLQERKGVSSSLLPTLSSPHSKHRRKSSSGGGGLSHDDIDFSHSVADDVLTPRKSAPRVQRKYDIQSVYQMAEKYTDMKSDLEVGGDNLKTSFEDALNSFPASQLLQTEKMKARVKRRLSSSAASSKSSTKATENATSTSNHDNQTVSEEMNPSLSKKSKMQKIVMSSANILTKRSKTGGNYAATSTGKSVEMKPVATKVSHPVNKAGYEELLLQASEQINLEKTDKTKSTMSDIQSISKISSTSSTTKSSISTPSPSKVLKRPPSLSSGKRKISLRNLSSVKSGAGVEEKETPVSRGSAVLQDSLATTSAKSNSSLYDSNENLSAVEGAEHKTSCHECGKILSSAFALNCHMRKRHKGHSKKIFIPSAEGHSSTPMVSKAKNKGSKNGRESPDNAEESEQACCRLTLNSLNASGSELDDLSSLFEDSSDYDSFDGFMPEEKTVFYSATNHNDTKSDTSLISEVNEAEDRLKNDIHDNSEEAESGEEFSNKNKLEKLSNYSKPVAHLKKNEEISNDLSVNGVVSNHTETLVDGNMKKCGKKDCNDRNSFEHPLTEEQLAVLPVPYDTIFPTKKSRYANLSFLQTWDGQFECPVESCRATFINRKYLGEHIRRKKSNGHEIWGGILYPWRHSSVSGENLKCCKIRSVIDDKSSSIKSNIKEVDTTPVQCGNLCFSAELVGDAMEMHMSNSFCSSDSDEDCATKLDSSTQEIIEDLSIDVTATPIETEARMPRRLAYDEANVQMHLTLSPSKRRMREMQELTCLYNKRARKRIALALSPAKKLTINTTKSESPVIDSDVDEELECWLCKAPFLSKRNLTIHIQYHLQQIDRFRHKCNFKGCLYAFSNKSQLKAHKLLHDTYLPYICLFCPSSSKKFKSFRKLQIHEQSEHKKLKVNLPKLRKQFCINQAHSYTIKKYTGKKTNSEDLDASSFLANGHSSKEDEICEDCNLKLTTTSVATPRFCQHLILENTCYVMDDILWTVSHFSKSNSRLFVDGQYCDTNNQKMPEMSSTENQTKIATLQDATPVEIAHQTCHSSKSQHQSNELKQNESTCQLDESQKSNVELSKEICDTTEQTSIKASYHDNLTTGSYNEKSAKPVGGIVMKRSLRSHPNLCQVSETLCGDSRTYFSDFQQADQLLQLVSQQDDTSPTPKKTKKVNFVAENNVLKENSISGSNKSPESTRLGVRVQSAVEDSQFNSHGENSSLKTIERLQRNNLDVTLEGTCSGLARDQIERKNTCDVVNSSNHRKEMSSMDVVCRESVCDNEESYHGHDDHEMDHGVSEFQNEVVLYENRDTQNEEFHHDHQFNENHDEAMHHDDRGENHFVNYEEQELWQKHVPSYIPCQNDETNMKYQSTYWSDDNDNRFKNEIEDVLHHIICDIEIETQAKFLHQNDVTPIGVKYYTKRDLDRNPGMGLSVYGYRNLAFCARTLHNMQGDFIKRNISNTPVIPFNRDKNEVYSNHNGEYDNMYYDYDSGYNIHDFPQYPPQFNLVGHSGAIITELDEDMETKNNKYIKEPDRHHDVDMQVETNDIVSKSDDLQPGDIMQFEDMGEGWGNIAASAKPIQDYLPIGVDKIYHNRSRVIKAPGSNDTFVNPAVDLLSLAGNSQENDIIFTGQFPPYNNPSIIVGINSQNAASNFEAENLPGYSTPLVGLQNVINQISREDFPNANYLELMLFENDQHGPSTSNDKHHVTPSGDIHPDLLFPMRMVEDPCYRYHADENFSIFFKNLKECTPVQRDLFCEYSVRSKHYHEDFEASDVCVRSVYPLISDRERWLSFQCNKFESETDDTVVSGDVEMEQHAEENGTEEGTVETDRAGAVCDGAAGSEVTGDEIDVYRQSIDEFSDSPNLPFAGYKKRGRPVKHFDRNGKLSSQRNGFTLADIVAFCDNPRAMENIRSAKISCNKFTENKSSEKFDLLKLKEKREKERLREEKKLERLRKRKREAEMKREKSQARKMFKIQKLESKMKIKEPKRNKKKLKEEELNKKKNVEPIPITFSSKVDSDEERSFTDNSLTKSLGISDGINEESNLPEEPLFQELVPVLTRLEHTDFDVELPVTADGDKCNGDVETPPPGRDSEISTVESHEIPAVLSHEIPAVSSYEIPAVESHEMPAVSSQEISTVESHEIPAVSSHEIPAVSSHEIPAVSSHEISTVESHEIPAVTSHEMSTVESHEIPAVTSHEIPAVSSHEIPAVSSHEIPAVSSHEIPAVSSHEIPAVSLHEIPAVSSHEMPAVTSHEIPAVSSHEIPAVSSHEIPAVSSHEIPAVSSHEIPAVSSHEIPAVSSHELPAVSSHEIPAVSSHEISTVESHEIPAVTSHEMSTVESHEIPAVTSHEIPAVSSHEIPAVSSHEIHTVESHEIPAVTSQNECLTSKPTSENCNHLMSTSSSQNDGVQINISQHAVKKSVLKSPQSNEQVIKRKINDRKTKISSSVKHGGSSFHKNIPKPGPCFICYICNKWMGFCVKRYVMHLRNHSMKKAAYRCQFPKQFCLYSFNSMKESMVHAYMHNTEKPYPCLFCSKWLKTFKDMNTHRKEQHQNILEELQRNSILYLELMMPPKVRNTSSKAKSVHSRPLVSANVNRVQENCLHVECSKSTSQIQQPIKIVSSIEVSKPIAYESLPKSTPVTSAVIGDPKQFETPSSAADILSDSPSKTKSLDLPKSSQSDSRLHILSKPVRNKFTSKRCDQNLEIKDLTFDGKVVKKSRRHSVISVKLRQRLANILAKKGLSFNSTTTSESVVEMLPITNTISANCVSNNSFQYSINLAGMGKATDGHTQNLSKTRSFQPTSSFSYNHVNILAPHTSHRNSTGDTLSRDFDCPTTISDLCSKRGTFTSDLLSSLGREESDLDSDFFKIDTVPLTTVATLSSLSRSNNNDTAMEREREITQTVNSMDSSLSKNLNSAARVSGIRALPCKTVCKTSRESVTVHVPNSLTSRSVKPFYSAGNSSVSSKILPMAPATIFQRGKAQNRNKIGETGKPKIIDGNKNCWLQQITPKLANELTISSLSATELEFNKESSSQSYPVHKLQDIVRLQGQKVFNITKLITGNDSKSPNLTVGGQQQVAMATKPTATKVTPSDSDHTSHLSKQKRKPSHSMLHLTTATQSSAADNSFQSDRKRKMSSALRTFPQYELPLKQARNTFDVLMSLMRPAEKALADQVWEAQLNHDDRVHYCNNMFKKQTVAITRENIFALYYEVKQYGENMLHVDFEVGCKCPISSRCGASITSLKQHFFHVVQEHSISEIFDLMKPNWYLNVDKMASKDNQMYQKQNVNSTYKQKPIGLNSETQHNIDFVSVGQRENINSGGKEISSDVQHSLKGNHTEIEGGVFFSALENAPEKRKRVVIRMKKCRFPECGEFVSARNAKDHMTNHAERLHHQGGKIFPIFGSKVILERCEVERKLLEDVEERRTQFNNDVTNAASSLDDEVVTVDCDTPLTLLINTNADVIPDTSSLNKFASNDYFSDNTPTDSPLRCDLTNPISSFFRDVTTPTFSSIGDVTKFDGVVPAKHLRVLIKKLSDM